MYIHAYSLQDGYIGIYHVTQPWTWIQWTSQKEGIIYYWEGGMDYRASRTLNGGQTWQPFPWGKFNPPAKVTNR